MPTISPDEGERADFPRLGTRYMLRDEDTDGQFALLEHTIPPRSLAAPMHVHEREDEFSYVLAGRVGVQLGDEVTEAARASWWPSRGECPTPSGTPATRRLVCWS